MEDVRPGAREGGKRKKREEKLLKEQLEALSSSPFLLVQVKMLRDKISTADIVLATARLHMAVCVCVCG